MQRYQQVFISDITGKWSVFDNENDLGIITSVYYQEHPLSQWTLQHDMNSNNIFINIFKLTENNKREKISFVEKIELTTLNTLTIFFSIPVTGYVEIIFSNPLNGNIPIEIQ